VERHCGRLPSSPSGGEIKGHVEPDDRTPQRARDPNDNVLNELGTDTKAQPLLPLMRAYSRK